VARRIVDNLCYAAVVLELRGGPRAAARLRLDDAPSSGYFLSPGSGLRIDLLLDFPLPAALLARRGTTVRARSSAFLVASIWRIHSRVTWKLSLASRRFATRAPGG
jgi:hypothetical protein